MANPWDNDPIIAPAGPLPSPPEKAEKPKDPPSGFRWKNDGSLEAIPGGPADPNAKPAGGDKPAQVPDTAAKRVQDNVGTFVSLKSANDTFNDNYGGNLLGGMENTAQALSPIDVGTPGQREWWAAFKSTDNLIRNDLFGSALTANEKAAYEATTISPGMRPDIIRQNITRRVQIIQDALGRQREFMIKNGYKPEAVDALFAPILQAQDAIKNGAEKGDDKPPPLGATPAGAPSNPGPVDLPPRLIPGAGTANGEDGLQGAMQGNVRRVDDPALAGVKREYLARLQRGDDADSLIAYLKDAGLHSAGGWEGSIRAQARYRREHPNVSINQYDVSQIDDMGVQMTPGEVRWNMAAQTAPGAFAVNAGDALTGFSLDNIVGATGGNAERARAAIATTNEQHPVASALGTVAGVGGASMGLETGLGAAGMRAGVGRTLAADALYGAGAGAGGADYNNEGLPATVADRVLGAGKGAAASVAGSYLGQKVGGGMRNLATGVTNPSVKALQDAEVPLTLGQQLGRTGRFGAAVKGFEDRLSGLPVVGDMINARRAAGLEVWNSKAFDHALAPIGVKVGNKVGEEAMVAADEAVSKAYGKALTGKVVLADADFATDMTNAARTAMNLERVGPELAGNIKAILEPYFKGTSLTGEAMQQISRELRALKAAYRPDPMYHRISRAIDKMEDGVFGLFRRNAPEVLPAYNKAKAAARRLYILEDAVLKGKQTEGVFTPAQLGMAERQSVSRMEGKRTASTGRGPFHDMQRAAQNVLPNKVPDSGTAGRLLVPLAAVSAGGGADYATGGDGTFTALGAILAGAYTKAGQRILTKPGRGASGLTAKALQSERIRKLIGTTSVAGAVSASQQGQ